MAAQTDNKYDVYQWIKKIYDSCETLTHVVITDKIAQRFTEQYPDKDLEWELEWYSKTTVDRIILKTQ